jgi:putative transposase
MINILRRHEAGETVTELARELGIRDTEVQRWIARNASLGLGRAQRLQNLEEENRQLKKLVSDLTLDKEVLKAVIAHQKWGSLLNDKM